MHGQPYVPCEANHALDLDKKKHGRFCESLVRADQKQEWEKTIPKRLLGISHSSLSAAV